MRRWRSRGRWVSASGFSGLSKVACVRRYAQAGWAGPPAAWKRQLQTCNSVTVSVEGVVEVDPDAVARPPPRVVVRMPDAEADYIAHLIAQAVRAAGALGVLEVGEPERELAEALHEAAAPD